MFGLFKKDPLKSVTKKYHQLMGEAMNAQRNGNMALYAKLSSEADKLNQELERIKREMK